MKNTKMLFCFICLSAVFFLGCPSESVNMEEIARFPVDSLDNIVAQSDVDMDEEITSDGNGAVRISTQAPITLHLYETGDLDVEEARLIYRAKLRTRDVEGKAYLEMLCCFNDKGEFFSRALRSPLSGTTEWTVQETPFFLKAGENPDNIKLNMVIDGKGTVWVDDIHLLRGAL